MTSIPPFQSQSQPTSWRGPASQKPSPTPSFPAQPSKLGILDKDMSTGRFRIQGIPLAIRPTAAGDITAQKQYPSSSLSPKAMRDNHCISHIPNLRPTRPTARRRSLSEEMGKKETTLLTVNRLNAQILQCQDYAVISTFSAKPLFI